MIVLRRFFYLLFSPYKTMRKIALEKDKTQIYIIIGIILIFFYVSSLYKEHTITYYFAFFFSFAVTILYFFTVSRLFRKDITLISLIFTFTYSLFPTLVWFIFNFILYLILPPPRTTSFMGKSFSIVFISISIAIFLWKIILTYLALRFSTKLHFYRIIYIIIFYGLYFIPYTFLMYHLGVSRIPFI